MAEEDAFLVDNVKAGLCVDYTDAENAVKEMTTNFGKLDKFEGHDFKRWQKKMHFLLTTLKLVYVLTTPMPELKESEKSVVDDNPKVSKVSDESNMLAVVASVIYNVPVATKTDKETEPVVAAVESVVEKHNPKVTSKVSDESVKESVKVSVVKKSVKASSVVTDKLSSENQEKIDLVADKRSNDRVFQILVKTRQRLVTIVSEGVCYLTSKDEETYYFLLLTMV
nr:zinc finger, CCHC-type [Tanacetum cinerariifolium]